MTRATKPPRGPRGSGAATRGSAGLPFAIGRRQKPVRQAPGGDPPLGAGGSETLAGSRAFTIVELLVVIAVLGILITLIVTIASRAQYNQKVQNTRATMKNVELAIEQFATENPLRLVYDRKTDRTFGPYPPYQVAGDVTAPNTVASLLDRSRPPDKDGRLWHRLARDLGCSDPKGKWGDWVVMDTDQRSMERLNDDVRALSTYLAVFSPGAFTQIPESSLQPLARDPINLPNGEFVSTSGTARSGQTNDPDILTARKQILGIHDAWGVPLDYFLYLKVQWSHSDRRFHVVDRAPVLRSLGIEREAFDLLRKSGAERLSDPRKWIFSREMPAPYMPVTDLYGTLRMPLEKDDQQEGWLRAVATGPVQFPFEGREDYDFEPGRRSR